MASIINASTSGAGGLISTADASGQLQLQASGATVVNFTNTGGTAPRITGDFSNATQSNKVIFQTSTTNGDTVITAIPNGTSKYSGLQLFNSSSDPDNASSLLLNTNAAGTYINISSTRTGTGTFLPLQFFTSGAAQTRIETNGDFQFNSGYGYAATAYGCRAWVNFNGTGTVAIRASGNVSSITDNGTGDYTVNFTTAMPDANYSALANAGDGTNYDVFARLNTAGTTYSTSSLRFKTSNNGGSAVDCSIVTVAIHR